MKALHQKVNIVPIIAKADSLTPIEVKKLKERVRKIIHNISASEIKKAEHKIQLPQAKSTSSILLVLLISQEVCHIVTNKLCYQQPILLVIHKYHLVWNSITAATLTFKDNVENCPDN